MRSTLGSVTTNATGRFGSGPDALRVRRTRVNGHRGQSSTAPENTLPALLDAVSLGANGLEFDVRLTADGHVVLMHDATLRRTTDVADVFPGRADDPVESFTARELARLDAGSWKGPLWAGTPIPFLADALKAVRRTRVSLSIELKAGPTEPLAFAEALRTTVRSRGGLTVMSFHRPYLDAVRVLVPDVNVGLVSVRKPSIEDLAVYDEFHLDAKFIGQRTVERAHALGKPITAWTVDSPIRAKSLARLGVDAITTNRVGTIRQALTPLPAR